MKSMLSITEFCHDHGISRSVFYRLTKERRAPRAVKVGRRTLISREAAEAWRRRMEHETALATGENA